MSSCSSDAGLPLLHHPSLLHQQRTPISCFTAGVIAPHYSHSRGPAKPNCAAAATLSSLHRWSSRPVRCSFNTSRLARFFRARRPTCEIGGPHARLLLSFLALYAYFLLRVKAALLYLTRLDTKAWVGGFTHSQLVWEMVCNFCSLVLSPPQTYQALTMLPRLAQIDMQTRESKKK